MIEKFFYEMKPFIMLFSSIYAIHNLQAYKPLVVPSAILLMLAGALILMMRHTYRQKRNRRFH